MPARIEDQRRPDATEDVKMSWKDLKDLLGPLFLVGGFMVSVGAFYSSQSSLSAQVGEMNKTLSSSLKDLNATVYGQNQQAEKIKSLEVNLDRVNQQLTLMVERTNLRLDKAMEDGRARNGAQDGQINEGAANRRLDRADLDRVISDVRNIIENANRPIQGPRNVGR